MAWCNIKTWKAADSLFYYVLMYQIVGLKEDVLYF